MHQMTTSVEADHLTVLKVRSPKTEPLVGRRSFCRLCGAVHLLGSPASGGPAFWLLAPSSVLKSSSSLLVVGFFWGGSSFCLVYAVNYEQFKVSPGTALRLCVVLLRARRLWGAQGEQWGSEKLRSGGRNSAVGSGFSADEPTVPIK